MTIIAVALLAAALPPLTLFLLERRRRRRFPIPLGDGARMSDPDGWTRPSYVALEITRCTRIIAAALGVGVIDLMALSADLNVAIVPVVRGHGLTRDGNVESAGVDDLLHGLAHWYMHRLGYGADLRHSERDAWARIAIEKREQEALTGLRPYRHG